MLPKRVHDPIVRMSTVFEYPKHFHLRRKESASFGCRIFLRDVDTFGKAHWYLKGSSDSK